MVFPFGDLWVCPFIWGLTLSTRLCTPPSTAPPARCNHFSATLLIFTLHLYPLPAFYRPHVWVSFLKLVQCLPWPPGSLDS